MRPTSALHLCLLLLQTLKGYVAEDQVRNATSAIARGSSGVQNVTLSNGYTFEVLRNSDIAGPGWTIIQQRIRGGVDFYRNWATYRNGFGDFWNGDFFLGLEKIYRLTAEQPHELYIHMERFDGSSYFARYDGFFISSEDDQYKLTKLGSFSGSTYYNALVFHVNKSFSTYDRDNDINDSRNCATDAQGGWWYENCGSCNLNGKYYQTQVRQWNSIYWEGYLSLKQVKMMIRPIEA